MHHTREADVLSVDFGREHDMSTKMQMYITGGHDTIRLPSETTGSDLQDNLQVSSSSL